MPRGSRDSTTSSTRARRRRVPCAPWRGLLVLALGLAAMAETPRSWAELVVLTDGRHIKATAFERIGDRLRLVLPAGGELTLSLRRVERVIDDEIVDGADFDSRMPIVFDFEGDPEVPDTPYGELIHATAERHSINPDLVAAVIAVESAFDPEAVSVKGAQGLMQLMPATALRFGVEADEAFQPAANIEAGTRYLAWLGDRFPGDLPKVLAAYNAGEGNVDRYEGVPPFRETRNYVQKVYARLGLEPALAVAE